MRAKQIYGKQLKITISEIEPTEVKDLTLSMDNRLLVVIEKGILRY